jgi:phosphoribosyl-ATP pyrophosphohydrolase/phosphoribosyl-AMP cyclohydrolase
MKFDSNNLIPAIIQDNNTLQVLMLGYMNQEAYDETLKTKRVTFYSRSKQRLWTKGETSGNYLNVITIDKDCDQDTLLIKVNPEGPACHLNTISCFGEQGPQGVGFIAYLEQVILKRKQEQPKDSYTVKLLNEGILRLAQKVGEEGVEVALAAVAEQDKFCDEMSDLWYHALMLLVGSGKSIDDVITIMQQRHQDYKHKG